MGEWTNENPERRRRAVRVRKLRGHPAERECERATCSLPAFGWYWMHGTDPDDCMNFRALCNAHGAQGEWEDGGVSHAAHVGVPMPDTTRRAIRASHLGRRHTPETIARMQTAQRKRFSKGDSSAR